MDIGGSLAVWAELLEGLASVVPLSPLVYQSAILDILFSILTDMMNQPGIHLISVLLQARAIIKLNTIKKLFTFRPRVYSLLRNLFDNFIHTEMACQQ